MSVRLVNGEIVSAPNDRSPRSLLDLIADKHAEIITEFEKAVEALYVGYLPEQKETFFQQKEEAFGWYADNSYPTPFIDGMVLSGIRSKQEIVDLIIHKTNLIAPDAGALLEKYQALEKQIEVVNPDGEDEIEKVKLVLIVWS